MKTLRGLDSDLLGAILMIIWFIGYLGVGFGTAYLWGLGPAFLISLIEFSIFCLAMGYYENKTSDTEDRGPR